MSSRRNGSVSRAAEAASKNRLHMDRNPTHSRITDPSNPAGRRKEIDNVMKRARQASPGSWDLKLLEVEEKDPNRWRHTGYKQMYMDSPPRRSTTPRRSNTPPHRRSRSPVNRRSRSRTPPPRRRSPVSRRDPAPAPAPSASRRRSPRRTPLSRVSPVRSPRRRSPATRRPPARRPPSPPAPPRKSSSGSSVSSCSDESCSVCSAKNKKTAPPPPPKGAKIPSRKTPSPSRPRGVGSGGAARAVQPTRELLKAREGSKRTREEKVLEWQRNTLPVPIPPEAIKREGGGPAPRDPRDPRDPREPRDPRRRRVSPAAITAALTAARHDSDSDDTPPTLTLHERFGKMAQWSADRSARLENMRITRREARLHVRIEGGATGASGAAPGATGAESPELGAYPEELLAAAPGGLPSWDDVTVRYEYYRARGYLRGLTLADYVKWEEWWYKYQEWLERERAFERWAEGGGGGAGGGGGRRGPRRSRRHRRS